MSRALRTLGWLFQSFGPLATFYVILEVWGLLPAIVTGLVLGAVLVAYEIWREKRASTLTLFTAASVAIFGVLDLKYQSGFFVKLEPALGNAATGAFFLGTTLLGRSLLVELVEQQRGGPAPEAVRRYLRHVTLAWGLFFFARAAGYVWMAYHLTLERALVIRGVLGPISLGLRCGGEVAWRFLRFGKRAFARPPAAPNSEGRAPG